MVKDFRKQPRIQQVNLLGDKRKSANSASLIDIAERYKYFKEEDDRFHR